MNTSTRMRGDLAAFVHALMEPQSDVALVDLEHNRLMRGTRMKAWRLADAARTAAVAGQNFCHAAGSLARRQGREDESQQLWRRAYDWTATMRKLTVDQILTPAPSVEAVRWKRRALGDIYLPGDRDAMLRAIAEDEAFLSAHPVSRKGIAGRAV